MVQFHEDNRECKNLHSAPNTAESRSEVQNCFLDMLTPRGLRNRGIGLPLVSLTRTPQSCIGICHRVVKKFYVTTSSCFYYDNHIEEMLRGNIAVLELQKYSFKKLSSKGKLFFTCGNIIG